MELTIPFAPWDVPIEEDLMGEPLGVLAMEAEPPSLALLTFEARTPFENDNEGTGGADDDVINVGCDAGE